MPRVNQHTHQWVIRGRRRGITLGRWLLLSVMICLGTAGCRSSGSVPSDASPRAYPADFALVLTVRGSAEADTGRDREPRHRSAQHVLTPDRLLRVALGPGVHADLYPPASAQVSIEQMALLYRLAAAARESADEASSPSETSPARPAPPPTVASANPITYRLTLTAHGQRWTYRFPPRENAAATALLDELIRLRGGS